jgi:hypothetical protein
VLGLAVVLDVLRGFLYGSEPKSSFMVGTGLLVWLSKTALPDLILGSIICAVVVRGGIEIIRNARSSASHEAISEES